jgi:hypothetical protein
VQKAMDDVREIADRVMKTEGERVRR